MTQYTNKYREKIDCCKLGRVTGEGQEQECKHSERQSGNKHLLLCTEFSFVTEKFVDFFLYFFFVCVSNRKINNVNVCASFLYISCLILSYLRRLLFLYSFFFLFFCVRCLLIVPHSFIFILMFGEASIQAILSSNLKLE